MQQPAILTNGALSAKSLLVTIGNDPVHRIVAGEMHAGYFNVDFYEAFSTPIEHGVDKLVSATGAYAATMSSLKSAEQLKKTTQIHARLVALSTHPEQKALLASRAHQYRYDLATIPIVGASPEGKRLHLTLDWINYLCDATAQTLRFPHDVVDRPLKGLFHRVNDSGWCVRLTREPLDLDEPEHLRMMKWAYDRFGVMKASEEEGPRQT